MQNQPLLLLNSWLFLLFPYSLGVAGGIFLRENMKCSCYCEQCFGLTDVKALHKDCVSNVSFNCVQTCCFTGLESKSAISEEQWRNRSSESCAPSNDNAHHGSLLLKQHAVLYMVYCVKISPKSSYSHGNHRYNYKR